MITIIILFGITIAYILIGMLISYVYLKRKGTPKDKADEIDQEMEFFVISFFWPAFMVSLPVCFVSDIVYKAIKNYQKQNDVVDEANDIISNRKTKVKK